MLHSYLSWTILEHYLNDFICILPSKVAIKERLTEDEKAYYLLTDCLGVPRQDAKNVYDTVVIVFGLKVDTNLFIIQVLAEKLARTFSKALSQFSITLKEIQSFTSFLSFYAQAIRLG